MKLTRRPAGFLHLQMGQETIYLLLVASLFASACLAAYVVRLKGAEEQPPIVTLRETDHYTFTPGSSDINVEFAQKLEREVVPRLRRDASRYDAYVIEVIGHTDEVPLHRQGSNLDRALLPWLNGQSSVQAQPNDNVGLGMTRAVAVARMLRTLGLEKPFVIVPLSAGPVVRPGDVVSDGSTTSEDQDRRRIELRLRRPPPRE